MELVRLVRAEPVLAVRVHRAVLDPWPAGIQTRLRSSSGTTARCRASARGTAPLHI